MKPFQWLTHKNPKDSPETSAERDVTRWISQKIRVIRWIKTQKIRHVGKWPRRLQSLSKITNSIHGHLSWKINQITYNRFMEYQFTAPKEFQRDNYGEVLFICLGFYWKVLSELITDDVWLPIGISMFWACRVMKIMLPRNPNGTYLLKFAW